ncbi:hypothetical protein BpHYR1_023447 [Brachionus plicatilis]|uniref:Uncharacterized protein n=1 Tax=Brachionus plicatilis TaxID=10195 RepID=A0A3M7Q6B7_BRAPC|nr:hypothetical protein BpHYR1_023447 [Brachionus plicatilis]
MFNNVLNVKKCAKIKSTSIERLCFIMLFILDSSLMFSYINGVKAPILAFHKHRSNIDRAITKFSVYVTRKKIQ